jgi:hypothetical protein
MKHWLASPHVQVEMGVLTQMKAFALSINTSTYMAGLAESVAETIDVRVRSLFLTLPC